MGPLIFLDILDAGRQRLLADLSAGIDLDYYMAGGTALSLQYGFRRSVDFDFFVPDFFHAPSLYRKLCSFSDATEAVRISDGTCDVRINGVQVSFFHYPNKLLSPPVTSPVIPGLKLAGARDIAAMKALAIGGRGAKKDFFDLYQIFQSTGLTAGELVSDLFEKYGEHYDFSYVGMGLNYFEDAEPEILPDVLVDYNWDDIKEFFQALQPGFFSCLDRHMSDGI